MATMDTNGDTTWTTWTTATWTTWSGGTAGALYTIYSDQGWNQEEEKRRKERIAAEKLADKKAHKLLTTNLNKQQLKEFRKDECISIVTPAGNSYLIEKGRQGNVIGLDNTGKRKYSYCAHPEIDCPDFDTMLAQKLMLEHKEKEFLEMANRDYL